MRCLGSWGFYLFLLYEMALACFAFISSYFKCFMVPCFIYRSTVSAFSFYFQSFCLSFDIAFRVYYCKLMLLNCVL